MDLDRKQLETIIDQMYVTGSRTLGSTVHVIY